MAETIKLEAEKPVRREIPTDNYRRVNGVLEQQWRVERVYESDGMGVGRTEWRIAQDATAIRQGEKPV